MAFLTYSIFSTPNTFSLTSFEVSNEFYTLFDNKLGFLRLEEVSRLIIEDFAKSNNFIVQGNRIFKQI